MSSSKARSIDSTVSCSRCGGVALAARGRAPYLCMLAGPLPGYPGSTFTRYPVRYFGIAAKLYVASGRSNSVSLIDTRSLSWSADVPVGELPWSVPIR